MERSVRESALIWIPDRVGNDGAAVPQGLGRNTLPQVLILLLCLFSYSLAQNIYIYPNKKLADQGLLEYRRYTPEEAEAYEQGGSFDPYLPLDWGPERRLTEQEYVYRARVVTSGDLLFVAYQTITARGTHFIASQNGGVDWGPYVTLDDTTRIFYQNFPEIVKDNSNLLIGFMCYWQGHGFNPGYYGSTDLGETWGGLSVILPNYSYDLTLYSSVSNEEHRLYFSYCDYDRDSLYVLSSPNWGGTWDGRGVNVAHLSSTPQPMTVRASGNNVHLAWVNEEHPISCRYSRSTDAGLTWSEEINMSDDEDGAQRVFVAVQDTHVVASWMGYKYSPYSFTGDLFIRQSFDSGATWGQEQVITELHEVWSGTVYIEGALIVAVWEDDRFRDVNNNSEAFAIFSEDYGASWSEETRLSYGDNHSYDPIACATGDLIHVLWGDIRPDAPGLYYCVDDLSTEIESRETLPLINIYIDSYPNPFNGRTIITYRGMEGGDIEIYNLAGQLVRTMTVSGKEGQNIWDATDGAGHQVSSGIYFLRARTTTAYTSKKIIYLK